MDLVALAAELTAGHPGTGAYNVDDALAAGELNAVNRPNNAPLSDVLQYIVERNHRTQQGTDTTYTTILGRLYHAANSAVDSNPFGRGAGNELTLVQKNACQFFVALFESPHLSSINFADTNLPTGQVNGVGVWSSGHATAIEALSNNQISRGQELGFGFVGHADVEDARAL